MGNQRGRPMKARPRILQTARALFLQHGLDVSLDTIAAEAGTTRPTLYSHFPGGKDALLLETFAFLNDAMQPPLQRTASRICRRCCGGLRKWCNNTFMRRRIFTFNACLSRCWCRSPSFTSRSNNAPQDAYCRRSAISSLRNEIRVS